MASRSASRTLRSSLSKQLPAAPTQRRSIVPAVNAARIATTHVARPAFALQTQQWRGMKTIDFAGTKETVYGSNVEEIPSSDLY